MISQLRLTGPQWKELAELATGPQSTYGKHRARVQNCLVGKKLAIFTDDAGTEQRRYTVVAGRMMLNLDATQCCITIAGRVALENRRR